MIFFDNSSTTYVYPQVIDTITKVMRDYWGNPNNLYSFGLKSAKIVSDSRKKIASILNVYPEEIFFTSCASESNAFAIAQADCCLCSPYDHHDIKDNSASIIIKEDEDLSFYNSSNIAIIRSHTWVSSETGKIFDIDDICKRAKDHNMLTLIDGTQALGNILVNPHAHPDVDFMSFSLHKCHGPKGIGILYIKKDMIDRCSPIIYGTQESNLRGGTLNVPYIVGGALALEMATSEMPKKYVRCLEIKNFILNRIRDYNFDCIVLTDKNSVPSILSLAFKNITGESIMLMLDSEDICVSTGTACTSGDLKPSDALVDMGIPEDYLHGMIRISIGSQNTLQEAETLVETLNNILNKE